MKAKDKDFDRIEFGQDAFGTHEISVCHPNGTGGTVRFNVRELAEHPAELKTLLNGLGNILCTAACYLKRG